LIPPDFRFNVSQFRACIVDDIQPPPTAEFRTCLDPSLTSGEKSDPSAIATGWLDDYDLSVDGMRGLNVVEIKVGHWYGMELPRQVVNTLREWGPKEVNVEKQPGSDLLCDTIALQSELHNVTTGRIRQFISRSPKPVRIYRLQGLLDTHMLRIQQGSHVEVLLEQAENYLFTPSNSGRDDDALDAVAMLAGFR
jgi:hypothetical protein